MKPIALILACCGTLAACSGQHRAPAAASAVKEDAFRGGKISMRTIEGDGPQDLAVSVGVLAFRDAGDAARGVLLAELLSTELSHAKGIRVVERQRIGDLEKELLLGDTGPVDQATAARIGGMIGANVMAFGGVSTMGKKALLTVRLVKVETGEIVGGVTERTENLEKLDELAEAAAKKLAAGMAR